MCVSRACLCIAQVSIFDDGCAEEASLLFQFDPDAAPGDKNIELRMFFGRTMIEARVASSLFNNVSRFLSAAAAPAQEQSDSQPARTSSA